ncbi:MAG: DUF4065 domain-containing protein [Chloroflexi bacterium]|jgi:putative zinc finger/helix-turn-helix YgiT family protein|nr:DUF4065 domain-containing protein [Chloroflexota bacterium]
MKISCPTCDETKMLKMIKSTKEISVRNDKITVEVEYYQCIACGEEFLVPQPENDPFVKAYRKYRQKHMLLQPEEIKAFRRKYKLTQGELADLLGLGGATLSRYETGKIQDESHDTLLRLVLNPENLQGLITASPGILSEEKKLKILNVMKESEEPRIDMLERFVIRNFSDYPADELSGFKRFDRDKFLNAILYFCSGDGESKTKLNKLLFYADFQHFKEYTNSITGAQYARVPFGPAPNGYDLYYSILVQRGSIRAEEVEYPGFASHKTGFTGEKYVAREVPDLNIFSPGELRILATVKERFKGFSAKEISGCSHLEKGYTETSTGKIISYAYAKYLKL